MQQEVFEVTRERFHLLDENLYILQGYFPKECEAEACLDDQKLETCMESWNNNSVMARSRENESGMDVTVKVTLPESLSGKKRLTLYAVSPEKRIKWFAVSAKELERKKGRPYYYIEEEKLDSENHSIQIRGWVAFAEPVDIKVYDLQEKEVPCSLQWFNRMDVVNVYKETKMNEKCGFLLDLHNVNASEFALKFISGEKMAEYRIHTKQSVFLKRKLEMYAKKGTRYLKNHGGKAFIKKAAGKFKTKKSAPVSYQKWVKYYFPKAAELEKQRNTHFAWQPKISVVVPLYKTPDKYLCALVKSLQAQTYSNWELCFSDGSGADSPLTGILEQLQKEESRIKVVYCGKQLQISENTNAAIEIAAGDFVAFADHDDELMPNALYECVKALNEKKDLEVLYSDEDKMTMNGRKLFQPHFKPDFNIDLLCTVNYICHLFVAKRELIQKVGMLRSEFDGAQDYDFIFRCTEAAGTEKIHHIPKILYHWRCHEGSTAENPESKLYAFQAGQRAVQAHYERLGIPAEITEGEFLGLYRTKFLWTEKPLISILIPNKDHIDDLKRCIDSIEEKSSYRNYEIIVIENNSDQEETFAYYKELEKENPRVKVVYWDGIFNYSAINNFGAQYANGEYLLLLNNDTEIINADCLEEMLGYCMREDVGAVGARLYYDDDTIQHAGVVVGFGGIAGHCFVQQPRGFTGYCHRIICAQDYSAVTAACMMVKRKAFEEVDGLSEELQVAFNDIDFCMKLRSAGYLIVYNPYAELYHYESKSRGLEDTPEKVARFNREIATFERRWPEILKNGDPFYNPNLTLRSQDFSLRRLDE